MCIRDSSQTRLASFGKLRIGEREFEVEGDSWFDHEWSSAALAEGLNGWDWFSLQLDNNTELMLYLLRYEDGRLEAASSGSFVDSRGLKTHLSLDDFKVQKLAEHRSPRGVLYPSQWRLRVPSQNLNLVVSPTMENQEMASSIPYWEGAVKVSGTASGRDIEGYGFVELTGY